jgi:N-6 DNA Methylase
MGRKNRNPFPFTVDPHKHTIVELMRGLFSRHNPYKVFTDFVEISAIALSNGLDRAQFQKREKRYLDIVKGYTREELNDFCRMFAELVLCYEQRVTALGAAGLKPDGFADVGDVLGSIFSLLEIGNDRLGQFFTPYSISAMMARMILSEDELREKTLSNGFVTVLEPACGAGGMVIAVAEMVHKLGFNYQKQMHAWCVDKDPCCVHMAYLQLSLLGIPATVVHGNSLTNETWDTWYTPIHIVGGWNYRLRNRLEKEKILIDRAAKAAQPVSEIIVAETASPESPDQDTGLRASQASSRKTHPKETRVSSSA